MDPAVIRLLGAEEKPKAPGMKYRHYAPKAPVTVVTGEPETSAAYIAAHAGAKDGIICFAEFVPLFTEGAGARLVMDLGPAGEDVYKRQIPTAPISGRWRPATRPRR